jgi:hypothetical protein
MSSIMKNYGFSTAIRLRLQSAFPIDRAQEAGSAVQAFLNAHANRIPNLFGVTVKQAPSVMLDGTIAVLPLQLQTERDLPFSEKLALARDVAAYARMVVAVPYVAEILEDAQPSIAMVGW